MDSSLVHLFNRFAGSLEIDPRLVGHLPRPGEECLGEPTWTLKARVAREDLVFTELFLVRAPSAEPPSMILPRTTLSG